MPDLLQAFLHPPAQEELPPAFHLALQQGWDLARTQGKNFAGPDAFLRDVVFSRARDPSAYLFFSRPLLGYLNAPAPAKTALPLTRFMMTVFEGLGEARARFDLTGMEDALRFYHAYAGRIARDYCLPVELVPQAILDLLRKAEAALDPPPGAQCRIVREEDFKPPTAPLADGVTLIGPADVQNGLGAALRYMAEGFLAANLPVSVFNRYPASPLSSDDKRYLRLQTAAPATKTNIIHFNSDMLAGNMLFCGIPHFAGRANIGNFYWETSKLSRTHRLGIDLVDEIWVASEFVRALYAAATGKPVINIGSVVEPPPAEKNRAALGLPEDEFLFIFTFDTNSRMTRKNPSALVEAFSRAFPGQKGVGLVIKTQNGAALTHPLEKELFAMLKAQAAADPRIRLIDETWTPEKLACFLASGDVYASLHRCEGLGYGMAEAMALGRPVIATGWSGNADFVREDTALPVPSKLVPVLPGQFHYAEEGGHFWAEPDIDAAAAAMQSLFEDREKAARLAKAGQEWIHAHYSAQAVGARIKARLAELGMTSNMEQKPGSP